MTSPESGQMGRVGTPGGYCCDAGARAWPEACPWHGTPADLIREVERLRAALESVCNVGDRAAVLTAREALAKTGKEPSDA